MRESEKQNHEFFDKMSAIWKNDDESVFSSLLDKIDIKESDRILDVGCGHGVLSNYLCRKTKEMVTGLDISGEMIKEAALLHEGKNVRYINESFYDFNDGKYDLIIIYNAYPHFVERDLFKESLNRLLNKGGRFVICHSLSRKRLENHHGGLSCYLSRNLDEVKTEASFYNDMFKIEVQEEGDNSYLIIGRKNV